MRVPLTLALLASCALLVSAGCTAALDCNARECIDCGCTNGKCTCADGWSGEYCKKPFCLNRTSGCSGHGDCHSTLYNISCACDDGFIGDHCETATCALKCKHGGSPNADCTACEGCLGAWGGKLCDTWDATVPASTLMTKLHTIANSSQKMLDDQAQFNPVCRQGHECVGWGIDGATGKPTAFPIVHLSYDPTRTDKRFNNMSEPVEVESSHVVSPVWSSADGAHSFPRIEDYVQYVDSTYAGATPAPKGTNGIYGQGFPSVFNTYFQKTDDRALSVMRATKSYIQMALPLDPTTHTRQYQLDRYTELFLQSLPPAYDTAENKQQFKFFIERYGTSFATSATLGGLVEQYSSWKSWLTDSRLGAFTADSLAKNAQIDFSAKTGLPGPGGAHDAGYTNVTRTLEPLECVGGDSSISCDNNFAKWAATIPSSPVLLDYAIAPISDLILDPDVKAAVDAAVKEYVAEQAAAWAALNKCPTSCGAAGAGSCAAGASSCTCSYGGLAGRMCTGCAPTAVKGTFTDMDGKQYSGTVTVACDGKEVVAWSGDSPCVGFLPVGIGACTGTGSALCSRAANGDLIATVKQPACTMANAGDDGSNVLQDTAQARRLRGAQGVYLGSNDDDLAWGVACGDYDASSSAGAEVTGQSAAVDANADKHAQCWTEIPSGRRRRNSAKPCKLSAKCEFV